MNGYSNPGRGTLILVLGILSIMVCGLLGPVAWVLGAADLKEIKAGRISPEARGATQGGMICGILGTAFLIIGVILGLWIVFSGFDFSVLLQDN